MTHARVSQPVRHQMFVFFFVALLVNSAIAGPLSSFEEVRRKVGDPNVRLLDVRPRADYDKGHCPGAIWVDTRPAQALAAKPGGLTDREAWEAWLAPMGIGPGTEVLIFDGARQLEAARVWWLMGYLGVERVGLIDGNFPAWTSAGMDVTTEVPKVGPRPFAVKFKAERHATRDDVLAAVKAGKTSIVDARSLDEYTGAKKSSTRGGHIPAACRLEWSDLVDKDGRFLDRAEVIARLARLGIKPGEPIITHCQGGGRASVDAFAFERVGFPTRNFYLGWSDWGNTADTPILEGAEPGKRP